MMIQLTAVLPFLAYFFIMTLVNVALSLIGVPFRKAFRLDYLFMVIFNTCALLYTAYLGQFQDINYQPIVKLTGISIGLFTFDMFIRLVVKYVRERKFPS